MVPIKATCQKMTRLMRDLAAKQHKQVRFIFGGANTLPESWGIAPINLKVGLCNRTDLQVVLDTYGSVRTRDRVGR